MLDVLGVEGLRSGRTHPMEHRDRLPFDDVIAWAVSILTSFWLSAARGARAVTKPGSAEVMWPMKCGECVRTECGTTSPKRYSR